MNWFEVRENKYAQKFSFQKVRENKSARKIVRIRQLFIGDGKKVWFKTNDKGSKQDLLGFRNYDDPDLDFFKNEAHNIIKK